MLRNLKRCFSISENLKKEIMIEVISAPDNVTAFRAIGEVTKEDYQNVVVPAVEKLIGKVNEINFLLVLDTGVENFTAGAWVQDALLGLKNFGKWNRAAIVSDSDAVINFTNGFSYIAPGEFRGFKKAGFYKALNWVAGH
jgi:hypothetical protein